MVSPLNRVSRSLVLLRLAEGSVTGDNAFMYLIQGNIITNKTVPSVEVGFVGLLETGMGCDLADCLKIALEAGRIVGSCISQHLCDNVLKTISNDKDPQMLGSLLQTISTKKEKRQHHANEEVQRLIMKLEEADKKQENSCNRQESMFGRTFTMQRPLQRHLR
jgi:hypothetical protein